MASSISFLIPTLSIFGICYSCNIDILNSICGLKLKKEESCCDSDSIDNNDDSDCDCKCDNCNCNNSDCKCGDCNCNSSDCKCENAGEGAAGILICSCDYYCSCFDCFSFFSYFSFKQNIFLSFL